MQRMPLGNEGFPAINRLARPPQFLGEELRGSLYLQAKLVLFTSCASKLISIETRELSFE